MGYTIRKSSLYQILFAICISVPYLNNYELTFGVWTVAAMLTVTRKYSLTIIEHVACFLAILAIAMIVMLNYDYKTYFILRDFAYIVKPAIGLLLGYQLCIGNFRYAMQTIVNTAVFIAVIHLLVIVHSVVVEHALTVNDIRLTSGFFSDYEVYALIILIFHEKFELGFSRQKRRYFIWVIAVSSFMYLCRTNFIQFVILFVAMKGYLKINRASIMVVSAVIISTVVGYSAILYYNPKRNGPGIEALLYKIKVAPIEPFKTKIDRFDWRDINDNYRSYENIVTMKQVGLKGTSAVILGEGAGSKIDLKQEMWLGDAYLRYISILHNGFMTIFLKSGLLGVFILLMSITLFFKNKKSRIPIVTNINMLMIGTGFFMLASYWVFMGFYFIADTKSVLLGFLICYKVLAAKQIATVQND